MNELTSLVDPDELHISALDINSGSKLSKHSKQTPKYCSRSHNSINDRATTKTRIIAMARIFKREIVFTSIVIFVLFVILNTTKPTTTLNHTYNKPFTNVRIDTRKKINEIQNSNKLDVKPLIIYNRVGKCGSRSLLLTISEAVHLKYFDLTFISSPHNSQTYIKGCRQQLDLIAQLVSTLEKPIFFSRNINYLNFSDQPNHRVDPMNLTIRVRIRCSLLRFGKRSDLHKYDQEFGGPVRFALLFSGIR